MAYECPYCEEETVEKVNDPFKDYVWECEDCGPIESEQIDAL